MYLIIRKNRNTLKPKYIKEHILNHKGTHLEVIKEHILSIKEHIYIL